MSTTTNQPETTDRIEKRLDVAAPRARVWRALSDATEFGTWFGITLDGPFAPGVTVHGSLRMPGLEHVTIEMRIDRVEPEDYFSYRWHPGAIDPKVDYSAEAMTLVEFLLAETPAGTSITIIESGFDQLPATRRAEAFRMNTGGWNGQSKKLAAYVE
jgi:uncharacterized protein YndB with AHSA1/START domain